MTKRQTKRTKDFEKVSSYKKRFSGESSQRLQERLSNGALFKEASIAIREILKERADSEPKSEATRH